MSATWIDDLLGGAPPAEGECVTRRNVMLVGREGLSRDQKIHDAAQAQTRDMFAYKWRRESTYASDALRSAQLAWLDSRYGGRNLLDHLGCGANERPLVLDAGCGAGFSAKLIFNNLFHRIRYVGTDISEAIDIAAREIRALSMDSFFVQADLMRLPLADGAFDVVVAEGVLHHTPSTRDALHALARLLKPGGIFAFYVYNKKAPIREFTDDYIREQVADLPPEEAWRAIESLTRLGVALGELNVEIAVSEDVPLLGIVKGQYNIQRLFYWAICKAYYRPEFSFEEMNHINFDWFTPKYCHRQTPQEVISWCNEAGLSLEHITTEEAGITVVARRPTTRG